MRAAFQVSLKKPRLSAKRRGTSRFTSGIAVSEISSVKLPLVGCNGSTGSRRHPDASLRPVNHAVEASATEFLKAVSARIAGIPEVFFYRAICSMSAGAGRISPASDSS